MADELDDEGLVAIAAALEGCPGSDFKARLRQSLQRSIEMTIAPDVPATTHGARPGFTAVTPYVMTRDIEPVIAFVKQAFGARETLRSSGAAEGVHCELRIGDSMLMLGGGGPSDVPSRIVGLHLYVEDADAIYEQALAAGAESLGAPADRPYGERSGFVKDPAGNHWYISTPLGPSYFAEAPRTLTPHLYVQRTAERGAAELIEFLQAAFGAALEMRHDFPDGTVGHAVMRLGGAAIEIGEGHQSQFAAPAAFYLYVPDCDALFDRAIHAGARTLHSPTDQPFGDRMGGVADAWGNEWFLATHRP
jgi:PhnB protein